MAKKGLAALASKQINSTAQPSTPAPIDAPHEAEAPGTTATKEVAPAQTSTGAKRGRPAATTAPDEVNVTFKLSAALMLKVKRFIIAYEEEMGVKLTQKEVVTKALNAYLSDPGLLDCPEFLDSYKH